jgi:hypothetical protein
MIIKKPLGYLSNGDGFPITEKVLTPAEATLLKLEPLSRACIRREYWMLHNMMVDCKRSNLPYCFVQEAHGISIWK